MTAFNVPEVLEDESEHTPAAQALEGLTASQAFTKLEGWPHSIAEIVAHLLFWQRQVLGGIDGQPPVAEVKSAAIGWPPVEDSDWPRIGDEYLAGLKRTRELARDPEVVGRLLRSNRTVGSRLVVHSGHDAYHLGQIVLLRRLMGAWPPPSGGMTW